MRIWKYPLAFVDTQEITMPFGAEIIHFDNQNEIPTLWALVDPAQGTTFKRNIRIAGTNHEITQRRQDLGCIGTAIFGGGTLVFHCFEIFQPEDQWQEPEV